MLQLYGENIGRFLHFVENKKLSATGKRDPFISHRVHRVVRERRALLEMLANEERFAEWPAEWAALCEGADADATRAIILHVAKARAVT